MTLIINPEWIGAAAEAVAAAEGGVTVFRKKTEEKVAPAQAPTAPTVVVNGMTGQEFLLGMFILAAAILLAAAIVHHGLTA
jgi:hypothetical protein